MFVVETSCLHIWNMQQAMKSEQSARRAYDLAQLCLHSSSKHANFEQLLKHNCKGNYISCWSIHDCSDLTNTHTIKLDLERSTYFDIHAQASANTPIWITTSTTKSV